MDWPGRRPTHLLPRGLAGPIRRLWPLPARASQPEGQLPGEGPSVVVIREIRLTAVIVTAVIAVAVAGIVVVAVVPAPVVHGS